MTVPSSYLCCGVRIDALGPESAIRALLASRYGLARGAHLCNSYTLSLALRDRDYRAALNTGHLNFADGFYVALLGRLKGRKEMTARVYGPDLMLATVDRGREQGLRHYLYGASPKTVARLADALHTRYPGVEIVGVESPPFRGLHTEEEAALAQRIAQARPDILWVGIGTPRQDHFVDRYAAALGCTVVPVGAAFDFHSGNKRSAPRFVQRTGFEWLYRFIQEPRRLWRRYLIGIPLFLIGVLTDLGRRAPGQPVPQHQPSADTAPASGTATNGAGVNGAAASGAAINGAAANGAAVAGSAVAAGNGQTATPRPRTPAETDPVDVDLPLWQSPQAQRAAGT